jgi:hypothetical protein
MKDLSRKDLTFSLCGLNCGLCPMRLGGYCPGCGGGAGNQPCAIARCSLQHDSVEYCFLCSEFPCTKYDGAEAYDSFITHQRQPSDIQRAQEIGMEAYDIEQTKKYEILKTLLSNYDDGRRKMFYCVAVNLLPLPQIEKIMEQVADNPSIDSLTVKEKAAYIVALFQDDASREGLVLKLRKKPAA